MSRVSDHLNGADLAAYLAATLTDLEFELLVRTRINNLFVRAHDNNENLYESHNGCSYTHSWADKSSWAVYVGATYSDRVGAHGEVLSKTMANACVQYDLQSSNKLSLLLPAPEPRVPDADETAAIDALLSLDKPPF